MNQETAEQWLARKRMEYMRQRAEEDRLLAEIQDFSVAALVAYCRKQLYGETKEQL